MSRISYLVRSPRRALTALGVVAAATTLTAGTGAYFADESASEGNSVQAGTLALTTFGSSDPAVDGNNCRTGNDKFVEPAGYQEECANLGVDTSAAGETGATIELKNLVPTKRKYDHWLTPAPLSYIRCFAVRNEGSVPLGLRIDLNTVGTSSEALASALKVQIVGFNTQVNNLFDLAAHVPFSEQSLQSILTKSPIPADARVLRSGRVPLEKGQTRPYCLSLRLTESDGDVTDELMSTGVKLRINFLGTSLSGDEARVAAGDYDGGAGDTTVPVVEDASELAQL